MKTLRKAILPLATAIALAAVAPAAAQESEEELVPPDNSAVNQYTETFPTAGGDKDLNKGNKGGKASPNRVLGSRNAQRLEQHGKAGRETAKLAAETAPQVDGTSTSTGTEAESGSTAAAAGSRGGGGGNAGGGSGGEPAGSGDGNANRAGQPVEPVEPAGAKLVVAPDVEGSSGLSEVLAQATGSTSSGQMGLFLPLLILATLAWAIVFALRRTREEPR
jgi:hypothetical protein